MVDEGSVLPAIMRESKNDVISKLYEKLDLFPSGEDAVASMLAGTHALVDDATYTQVILQNRYQVFTWYMVREQLFPGRASWIFPKHTPWKYKFDQGIRRMVEAGLVQRWIKVEMESLLGWDWKRQQLESAGQRTNMFLTLQHLQGVFYILILGWATSAAVFLLELLRHRCSRH